MIVIHACIQTPLCHHALPLTQITLVSTGKVLCVCLWVCMCVCVCVCICPFVRCITSCVSVTGPVPRWPPCHATLSLLRPTGSDTCEMLTWWVTSPSRASGCCSFSHSSPLLPFSLALSFFISLKGLKRLLSPSVHPSITFPFFLLFPSHND